MTELARLPRHFTGNWKIDTAQTGLSICPKTKSMFGICDCRHFGLRDFFRLLDRSNLLRFKNWMRGACSSEILEPMCFSLNTENGEILSYKITGFHCTGNWGLPNMALGVIEDITQKVQEDRVALSIINHEMRTPLSVMKLNAQMIQRSGNVPYKISPSEMASTIERHIDGLTSILDQYISHAPDSTEAEKLNRTDFDLNRLIDQVMNDMKGLHQDHQFCKTKNRPVMVNADRYLILQVLINYLTNAVKYSPKGSAIYVAINSKGQKIEVTVTDEGSGIAEADLSRVFERFYKADPLKTANGVSKGLGLNVVKQLIERHGGEAFVTRGSKGGSVFHFTLPRSAK